MRTTLSIMQLFSFASVACLTAAEPLDLNAFLNQDLRGTHSNRVASLVRFLDSQNTSSRTERQSLSPQPWFVWKLRSSAAFVVFEGQPIYSIPGTSSAAVHIFDSAARHLTSCTFSTGWRMELKTARLLEVPPLPAEVIEARTEPTRRTQHTPRRQFYGLIDSRLALIRLEGSKGDAFRNTYIYPNQMIGPAPPARTPDEWEAALKSNDYMVVLETLIWLGGRHLDASDDFSMRLVRDVSHEDVRDAKLFATVWQRGGVHKALDVLTSSKVQWVSEAAALAKTKDTSP
jgi:hypothetical protein